MKGLLSWGFVQIVCFVADFLQKTESGLVKMLNQEL